MAREILLAATSLDFSRPPPVLAAEIQAQVREITGCADPYRELKAHYNELALSSLPALEHAVCAAPDPLRAATALAIAANVIDLGAKSGLTESEVHAVLASAIDTPLAGELDAFCVAAAQARRILYLADNAGEIIFDRVLIAQLPRGCVTVAVRGGPVLNDATRADAQVAGLIPFAEIIDSGAAIPGTWLSSCSASFRRHFHNADLIIAKGQGNFETLSEVSAPLFCLFRVKCEIVAQRSGYPLGSNVVWRQSPRLGRGDYS